YLAQQFFKPLFAKLNLTWTLRFGDAVGEGEQDITRPQVNCPLFIAHFRKHAYNRSTHGKFLDVGIESAGSNEEWRIVTGIDVMQRPIAVDLCVEERRVLAGWRRPVQESVHLGGELWQGEVFLG